MRLPLVLVLVAPVMVEPGIVVPVIMPIIIVALASAPTIVVAAPMLVVPSLSGPTLIAPSQLAPPLLLVAPFLFTPATLRLVTPAELLTSEHAREVLSERKRKKKKAVLETIGPV